MVNSVEHELSNNCHIYILAIKQIIRSFDVVIYLCEDLRINIDNAILKV